MTSDDLPPLARRILASPKRLFNAIGMGKAEIVQNLLEFGGDANPCDKRGNPARAVRSSIVEASVVTALLEGGAHPANTDIEGHTALDHARRRLSK
jgi:ankyrin repeat protein